MLDIDYNSITEVVSLTDMYSEEERNKIFKPIVDLIENPKISFSYKKNINIEYKDISIIERNNINKLVSPKVVDVENIKDEKEYELVQFVAMVEKGKELKSIKVENSLFTQIEDKFIKLTEIDFEQHNLRINKEILIDVEIKNVNNNMVFKTFYEEQEFMYSEKASSNIDKGLTQLMKQLHSYISSK